MAVLRIPTSFLKVLIVVVVLLVIIFAFVTLHKTNTATTSSLPYSVQYALEYFNAVKQNSTLLVPSQYYTAARDFAINNNKVVENNSLYYSVLFSNVSLPSGYNILLDMANVSNLPDATFFPYNFTAKNLSSSLKNCEIASSNTDAFAVCSIYSNISVPVLNRNVTREVNLGFGTFVAFPNNPTLSEVNSTIVYNGENRSSFPSRLLNHTTFLNGSMFLYQNTFAFYLSPADLGTFYGREMFLPNSTLKNVIDNFLTTRIVSG
jgi:hypothetical protein